MKGDTVSKYCGSAQLVSAAVVAAFCSFLSIRLKKEIQLIQLRYAAAKAPFRMIYCYTRAGNDVKKEGEQVAIWQCVLILFLTSI